LIGQLCFGQEIPRKLLRAQVINDSIKVENVIVFNVNAKTGAMTTSQGFFTINAKANDTLVFSSLLFKSKKIVLTRDNMTSGVLKIKLQTFTNQLTEVVISKDKINNPVENSQAAVDKKYFEDQKSSPKNTVIPANPIENGADFVRMYKDVIKILKTNNPKKTDFTSANTFTEVVLNRMNYPFFNSTLKLNDDEIKLFLVFCENDSKAKTLVKSSTDFELSDFLIGKNIEFKKITIPQK
jgi:hypothetical protein